jgi:hypothetical protein
MSLSSYKSIPVNMKQIFNLFAFLNVAGVTFLACTKHNGDVEEYIPTASLAFTSPSQGEVMQGIDSMYIKALAISTATIHGYDVAIRKAGDTTKLFFKHRHDHNDTLYIDCRWKSTLAGLANLEAEIILYLDHNNHTKIAKVPFRVE